MADDPTILDPDGAVFAYPAAVRASELDAPGLLALAKKQRAIDPSIFDDSPPYFWQAEISSNRIDAYFTRMQKSSLQNYADEAETGVSFQNSHNCRELPLGRSLTGKFIGSQGNGLSRVEAAFFTIPDLQLGSVDTNQFIRGVRSGIISDVSIGFYGGRFICSICNLDIFDWECMHWPGDTYEIKNSKGETIRQEMAIANVEDAHLAETSAVYDGATPGAAIIKARQQMEAGRLTPETARVLESRYRIKLPGPRHVWPGKGEKQVAEPQTFKSTLAESPIDLSPISEESRGTFLELLTKYETELTNRASATTQPGDSETEMLPTIRTIAKDAGLPDDFKSATEGARLLAAEVVRLRPLADDGTTYRADLIEETLKEGVRAHGNAFPKETQQGMLEKATIADIKKMRDTFKAVADEKYKGGRLTVDNGDVDPPPVTNKIPAAAFAV